MRRSARIALLVSALSVAAAPALARAGGGHGGGRHGGGAHGFGGHGGHAGFVHGPEFGFSHHGRCGGSDGYFGLGLSDVERLYLDRIGPTPAPDDSAADDGYADDRWPDRPSAAEQTAQYQYDHRGGGD